eukprot:6711520-Pyramimonas_sp.AAC.1
MKGGDGHEIITPGTKRAKPYKTTPMNMGGKSPSPKNAAKKAMLKYDDLVVITKATMKRTARGRFTSQAHRGAKPRANAAW